MYKNLLKLFLSLAFFISTASYAQTTDCPPQVYHLKSGHTVVIKEIHTNPIVTVDTWVKTGSMNETPKNNGVSHFLEHLMFKGTKNYKVGEIDKILEAKGGKFNAATSKDFTHFYITIPAKDTDSAIKLNADMLLNATFPPEELNKERKVVIEEIRRSDDSPESTLFDNLISLVFKTHPYKYTTLGPAKNIASIPRNDILAYYHHYYIPPNMVTVVVGDVDSKKVLSELEENFKSEVGNKVAIPKYKSEPFSSKPRIKVEKGKYNFGYLYMGYKCVPIQDKKESYALDLAASILGGGKSSRLYQDLKEKQNIVSSIDSEHFTMRDDSIFVISADFDPSKYQKVKSSIESEVKKLGETKVSDEELNRAKTQSERAFIYANESIEEIAGAIGYVMTTEGDMDSYNNYIKYVNAVTADEIQKAVQKYIKPSRLATSVLLPIKPVQNATVPSPVVNVNNTNTAAKNQEINQNKPAPQCKKTNFATVASTQLSSKTVLDNGMTLITNKITSNDIVSLSVFVKGGKLLDSPPGITNLLVKTLMQGTKTKSALEITKEIEDMGIVISPTLDSDCFEIRMKSTRGDFDKAFNILADIINNPAFDNQYVEKGKKEILEDIIKAKDKPLSKASEAFAHAMYPNHPYGNLGSILEKSIPTLTKEQLVDFHKRIFVPQNMVVAVSGNIDQQEVANKFSCAFPAIAGKKLTYKPSSEFRKLPADKNIFQKDPTAAAWMIIGWPTEGIRNTKDYATLQVINSVLGGGMSSRLFKTFREKQGLCYAVDSTAPARIDGSFFAMYIGTEPKNIELVKTKFLQEMTRLKTEKVGKEELDSAKQKLIGDFLLGQETNQQKAHYLGWFEIIDKGFRFTYDFPDLINSVTSEDIINVSNKYFASPHILSIIAPEESLKNINKEK